MINVLICKYLKAEQVARIRQAMTQVCVHRRTDLIPNVSDMLVEFVGSMRAKKASQGFLATR